MKILVACLLLSVLATAAPAYELWLDIDTDGDPATINDFTTEASCTVNLVLAPSGASEEIWSIEFGLGGSCRECGGVFQYGTGFDLGDFATFTWETHPYFAGTFDYATCLCCPADPGYHAVFRAESIVDCCFEITEPIVFATFTAWRLDGEPGCRVPPNLAVMHAQGAEGVWNYIQIGEPAIPAEAAEWGGIKALYR